MSFYTKTIFLFLITILLGSCQAAKILFIVDDGKPLDRVATKVVVERKKAPEVVKKNLKLKPGDKILISEGVDGTGIRTFQTTSTVHGPATFVLTKEYLEQQDGIAMHDGKSGRLVIPEMSIDHSGAAYLVIIEEQTIELIVFDGRILVSPTNRNLPWKPFFVESMKRRKIWRDGRVAPDQPLTPEVLNEWIDNENQLLKAGGASIRMVPSVVTLPSEDAKGLIASAQFPVNHQYTQEGEGELGTISRQVPGAGRRIDAKSTVTIYERSRPVRVPSVFGLSLGAAIDSLRRVGLNGRDAGRTITGAVEPHMVNTQKPAAGELLAEGATVDLNVEALAVQVPNIVGQSVEQARITLGELKLKIDTTNYVIGFTQKPLVISQVPAGGSKVLPGSEILIIQQALGFELLNVVGKTATAATSSLVGEGFQVGQNEENFSDTVPKGVVISQQPPAGTTIGKDIQVILTVSKGKQE